MKKLMRFLKKALFACLILVASAYILSSGAFPRIAVSESVSGVEDERVALIQERLRDVGLYSGEINGVCDVATTDAVRRFQLYNGIEPSGICDTRTLQTLGIDFEDVYYAAGIDLLAKLVEAEAGGKGLRAMTAVAGVVFNRVASDSFPDDLPGVIYDAGAFASVKSGEFFDALPGDMAYRAAYDALIGVDVTGGALYFSRTDPGRDVTLECAGMYFYK